MASSLSRQIYHIERLTAADVLVLATWFSQPDQLLTPGVHVQVEALKCRKLQAGIEELMDLLHLDWHREDHGQPTVG